jgi:hypothetical protein
MDRQYAANLLDGNEYRREGAHTPDLFALMKRDGLVAIFGASDDLTEFRGAIHDEAGAGEETEHFLTRKGLLTSRCGEGDDCPYFAEKKDHLKPVIRALWCPPGFDGSWLIVADIPHATFDIMEDGEVYCRGVVISIEDLPQ